MKHITDAPLETERIGFLFCSLVIRLMGLFVVCGGLWELGGIGVWSGRSGGDTYLLCSALFIYADNAEKNILIPRVG